MQYFVYGSLFPLIFWGAIDKDRYSGTHCNDAGHTDASVFDSVLYDHLALCSYKHIVSTLLYTIFDVVCNAIFLELSHVKS